MNYEEKYKEALKSMRDLYNKMRYLSSTDALATTVTLENAFPELRESEDERIKKEIIDFIQEREIVCSNGDSFLPYKKWIAWLEKQGEQKPTDKVEPKFKVGDWITNGGLLVGQVTSFDGEYYHYMQEGIEQPLHISNAYNWHLWTIQDAKNGDVLANKDGAIFINACSNGGGTLDCHCYISVQGEFCLEEHKTGSWLYKTEIHPATKEQHKLLFQKMKEAGYEWDAEKKELNKIEKQGEQKPIIIIPKFKIGDIIKPKPYNEEHLIKDINENGYVLDVDIIVPFKDEDIWEIVEQKTTWSKEDENSGKKSEDVTEEKDMTEYKKGFECGKQRVLKYPEDFNLCKKHATWSEDDEAKLRDVIRLVEQGAPVRPISDHYTNWLKSLKDRFQLQPKQEWSEDDEHCIELLLPIIDSSSLIPKNRKKCKEFLKSLKSSHWKPSEEQLTALKNAIIGKRGPLYDLYFDLEKL